MVVYITCFFFSSLLFYFSKYLNKRTRNVIDAIAIFIPCLIAGIRSNTVGTDVSVYLEPMVANAHNASSIREYMLSSWRQGWVIRGVKDIEIGFSLLVFLIIKIFDSIYILQFVIQLLTIVPIYIGLRKSNVNNLWLGMLTYFCMFYNNSLNIMRQSIAVAFIFLAFQYLFNSEKIKFIIGLIVACLFHNSALLGILILLIYEFLGVKIFKKENTYKTESKRLLILTIAGIAILFIQNLIVKIMGMIGLSAYVHYIMGDLTFLPNQLIIRLPILILSVIYKEKLYQEENDKFYFYVCCIIYTIVFSQFASVNSFSYRIAMTFSIFQISFIPCVASIPSKIKLSYSKHFKFNRLIMFLYLLAWWSYYCLLKTDSTLPYTTNLF